ncbi:DNA repair protein RecN [Spiribacter salinus M19-40]|uniref:DNA repair protein RecN n=1 Tax=Spiribacter salinus M19-40 TaxID=1260251 RepID=R4VKG7_9GAMM|nr:DNA repair protein RecN [Spiribacter salinus]AGM41007.1 DNA repair protein RecN [Spiribacter salinus M19-40]
MLNEIGIRDFAIIERLELSLSNGLSVLTGETGAGKSILLDALGLCLGDRADTNMVPPHAERSEIHAGFDVSDAPRARDWLEAEDLAEDGECLLRRVIHSNGRSQAWINGRPATRAQLEALGQRLVGIHGQHAHQALARAEVQRRTLDGYAAHPSLLEPVATLHGQWRAIVSERAELAGGSDDHQDRIALLRYQLEELDAAAISEAAFAELEREQRRLAGAEQILGACQRSLDWLYDGDNAAQSLLAAAERELAEHLDTDAALGEATELFATAQVQLQEGCQTLRHFADHLEMDPARLAEVEHQLSTLHDLARKHHVEPEHLAEHAEQLRGELERLESADQRLIELAEAQAQTEKAYREAAEQLTASRQSAADGLMAEVNATLAELGMPGAALLIRVEPDREAEPARHGQDQVRFDVRTNPDQRPGPLNRIASGGELSRIGLALEVATAHTAELPCLIFDEADAGIGGAVAEVVGRKLRALSEHHQVLCITHLPQVASQGRHQLQVEKSQDAEGRTTTQVRHLADSERTEEIARMLGGVEITDQTLSHAREMLERAG